MTSTACVACKLTSKSNWFFNFLDLIFRNWTKIEWHSIFQKSSGDKKGVWQFTWIITKGHLISEWTFWAFKSPKKSTNFLTNLCPSFLGQKSDKNLVGFLGDLKTPKLHSEINRPLVALGHNQCFFAFRLFHCPQRSVNLRMNFQCLQISQKANQIFNKFLS